MNTSELAAEGVLQQAIVLAEGSGNLEIMDLTAILHGYLELTKLDPTNHAYRKNVEDAVATLLGTIDAPGLHPSR
jgi:hypothetical protein